MDAMGDRTIPMVVLKTSSQVGKTEMSLNAVGFHMDQDPAPMLVIQPTLDMAETWSKDRLAPMLRDTRALHGKVADARSRDSGNTIFHKEFEGGQISMAGANSAASLSMRPIRVLICDEVDRYPASASGEGDPVALATKRTTTFWNRKIILASTPTLQGFSRIDRAFATSDQRYFEVPCPHCGEFQRLEWGSKTSPYGMKWKQDTQGQHLPETAFYVCRFNGCIIEERSKGSMIHGGKWVPTRPFAGVAGFHIWAAYSLQVNSAWPVLVKEWLDAKGDAQTRQTFINLVLGEAYEERDDRALNEVRLASQVEVFPSEVPEGVGVLTAGVDVQNDRIEIEVVGWGRNEESWSVAHEVLEGDPDTVALWDKVDLYLKRLFHRGDGRGFEVRAACIDSGGHHTQRVYEFCKARLGRHVWAIKGEAARAGQRSPVWPTKRPSARNKQAFRPIIIGVNAAKDVIRTRLHLKPPAPGAPCPGFMHFPADRDINYFAQLVAERSVVKQVGAAKYRVWELLPGRANEALDLRVYAYAALCGMIHFGFRLNRRVDELEGAAGAVVVPNPTPPPTPAPVVGPTITTPETAAPRLSRLSRRLAR